MPILAPTTADSEVLRLMSTGEVQLAENLALENLGEQPQSPLLVAQVAALQWVQGSYEDSWKLLSRARKSHPDNLYLTMVAAELHLARGELSLAIDLANHISRLEPDRFEPHALLGRAWMNQALAETGTERASSILLSAQHYRRAFDNGCQDLSSYLEAASVDILRDSFRTAEDYLRAALAINEKDPGANHLMAYLAARNSEWARSEAYLTESLIRESVWKARSAELAIKVKANAELENQSGISKLARPALGLMAIVVALALSLVPTMFAWIAIDSFTGFFPPIWVIATTVPIAPLAVASINESGQRLLALFRHRSSVQRSIYQLG